MLSSWLNIEPRSLWNTECRFIWEAMCSKLKPYQKTCSGTCSSMWLWENDGFLTDIVFECLPPTLTLMFSMEICGFFSSLKCAVHQSVRPQVEPRRKSQHWAPALLRLFMEELPECVWRNEMSSAITEVRLLNDLGYSCLVVTTDLIVADLLTDRVFFFWMARIRKILFKLLWEVQLRAAESEKSEFLFPCKMQTQISLASTPVAQQTSPLSSLPTAPGWTPEKHQIPHKAWWWCCECVCVCSCASNPCSCLLSPCCLARLQSCTLAFWAMQWWTGAAWVPERNGLTQPNTRESRVRLNSPRWKKEKKGKSTLNHGVGSKKICRCAQIASREATTTCVHSSAETPEVTARSNI